MFVIRKEEIIKENLIQKQNKIKAENLIIPISVKEQDFIKLMNLYQKATEQVLENVNFIKEQSKKIYGHNMINNVTSRVKTPESIIKKMKKRHYELTYQNMIKNINDIAGIRITCPLKSDITEIKNIIKNMPNIIVIKEKNYIKKPKKSGYVAYHIIVKTPVNIGEQVFFVKVEIQIRTVAMDSWSIAEHKLKYKTEKKLSVLDSKKLSFYARIIDSIDNGITKIYQKQVN